jgi:hypothetical protein
VTPQCALKGRNGLVCEQAPNNCPWGIADQAFPMGESASRDMCIAPELKCPKP